MPHACARSPPSTMRRAAVQVAACSKRTSRKVRYFHKDTQSKAAVQEANVDLGRALERRDLEVRTAHAAWK